MHFSIYLSKKAFVIALRYDKIVNILQIKCNKEKTTYGF